MRLESTERTLSIKCGETKCTAHYEKLAGAVCTEDLELAALTVEKWHYVYIQLGTQVGVTQVVVDEAANAYRAASCFEFGAGERVDVYVSFSHAYFKEIKLYSNNRGTIYKELTRTQPNPAKDDLLFYYPLDGKQTTRYFYNTIAPESATELPLRDHYWVSHDFASIPLCPAGYYYEEFKQFSMCVKQQQLKLAASVIGLNTGRAIDDAESVKGVEMSVWVYYEDDVADMITLGSSQVKSLKLSLAANSMRVEILTGNVIAFPFKRKTWIHFTFTSLRGAQSCSALGTPDTTTAQLYINSELIKTFTAFDIYCDIDASNMINYELGLAAGSVIKDLHFISHTDASQLGSARNYPTSTGSLNLHVPGVALSASNELAVFVYGREVMYVSRNDQRLAMTPISNIDENSKTVLIKIDAMTEAVNYPFATGNYIKDPLLSKTTTSVPATVDWRMQILDHGASASAAFHIFATPLFTITFTSSAATWTYKDTSNVDATYVDMFNGQSRHIAVAMSVNIGTSIVTSGVVYLDGVKLFECRAEDLLESEVKEMIVFDKVVAVMPENSVRVWKAKLTAAEVADAFADSTVSDYETILACPKSEETLMLPNEREYFGGSKFMPATVLEIATKQSPGVAIPLKSTITKDMQWTLEVWVYISAIDKTCPIISIKGTNIELSITSVATKVSAKLVYGTVGTEVSVGVDTVGKWQHVAAVAKADYPIYSLSLGVNGEFASSEFTMLSQEYEFSYLYMGTDGSISENENKIYLKEIRVWNIPLPVTTIKNQMQRQISNPAQEYNLAYYFPIDEVTIDSLVNKAPEGHLQANRLWNTTSSPAPRLTTIFTPILKLCDQFSQHSKSADNCENEVSESQMSLEQSSASFVAPLSEYSFSVEWTLEFWLRVENVAGIGTSLFTQVCHPSANGTISLYKKGTNLLEFAILGREGKIGIAETGGQWVHYGFASSGHRLKLTAYRNGHVLGEAQGQPLALPSCDMTVGENSNVNVVIGKLKELRIWNESKTGFKLSYNSHRTPSASSLVFYLPLDEGHGDTVTERTRDRKIALAANAKAVWASQSELKICRSPYVYSAVDNVCTCKFGGEDVDPRVRQFVTGREDSFVQVACSEGVVDAETVEFWVKVYTDTSGLTEKIAIIKRSNTLTFSLDFGSGEVELELAGSQVLAAPFPSTKKWVHVAASLLYNNHNSYLAVDESISSFATDSIDASVICTSGALQLGTPSAADFTFGLRHFRQWSCYKAPGELQLFAPFSHLRLHLPLDESSGAAVCDTVLGKCSGGSSGEFWVGCEDEGIVVIGKKSALAFQVSGASDVVLESRIDPEVNLGSEYSIILWTMFSAKAKYTLMIQGSLNTNNCLVIEITAGGSVKPLQVTVCSESKAIVPRSLELTKHKWTAIGFVKSLGSYAASAYSKVYYNGVALKTDEVVQSVCNMCAGEENVLKLLHENRGEIAAIKELKVFGIVLSSSELIAETYRKGNSWKHLMHLKHYWALDEYPEKSIGERAINYPRDFYGPSNTVRNFYKMKANANAHWINSFPESLCESYEYYDTRTMRCVTRNKALMFVRGLTHSITIATSEVEKNFTTEFWLNLLDSESATQEILSTKHFTLYYSNSKLSLAAAPSSDSLQQLVSSATFPTNLWTHVAVGNAEYMGKSTIFVNAKEYASNTFLDFTDPITSWALSSDESGFTGTLRELRIWGEYRSAGRVRSSMHAHQWDYDGLEFKLVGYYKMDESGGVALCDYASREPKSVANFGNSKSGLKTPFWTRAERLPAMCSYNHVYDFEKDACRFGRKVLKIESEIELEVSQRFCFRDWSFHAWVRFSGTTEITVDKLFTVKEESGGLSLVAYKNGDSAATMNAITIPTVTPEWHHLSLGHSYGLQKLRLDLKAVGTGTIDFGEESDADNDASYCGNVAIVLKQGHFMHVSLWKKYLPSTLDAYGSVAASSAYIDPYFFSQPVECFTLSCTRTWRATGRWRKAVGTLWPTPPSTVPRPNSPPSLGQLTPTSQEICSSPNTSSHPPAQPALPFPVHIAAIAPKAATAKLALRRNTCLRGLARRLTRRRPSQAARCTRTQGSES